MLKSLTNTEIAAAKPQKTEYMLRDGDGLALLIKPSGRKIWYFEYTPPALKKRTKISIGPYPVVTLAMARDFRLQYRRLLVQGIDPQTHLEQVAEEQRLQNECTLEKVAEQWLKEKKRTSDRSEDHAKDVWRSLEMHVFPLWVTHPLPRSARRCSRNTSHRWKNRAYWKRCGELSHGSMKSSASPSP